LVFLNSPSSGTEYVIFCASASHGNMHSSIGRIIFFIILAFVI